MMAGSTSRQKKRKVEEERDPQRKESPERKRKKGATKCRPRKGRNTRRRPRQQKAKKPESFKSLYTVGEKIDEGGCGSVYTGTRIYDGLKVAIKMVPKHKGDRYIRSPDNSTSIPVEVALMQKMNEPPVNTILRLIQWFDEPECVILVLEYPHPCKDLYDYIVSNGGSLCEKEARHIMAQAMEAVIECHKRDVLHRDIKLENLLINVETLDVKLIDFGCGDLITECGYNRYIGTLQYCPPEFLLTKKYQATPSTVWSLGVLLYTLVTGILPFTTEYEIIDGHLNFNDELSSEFCELTKWCLQANPNWRPDLLQMSQHPWFQQSVPAQ